MKPLYVYYKSLKNSDSKLSFVCEDVDKNGLESAVKAKAGQMYVNCCSYELTVYGCTDKDGDIFTKGMSISVYAPSAMIYRETKFQVKELEIKRIPSVMKSGVNCFCFLQ